MENEKLVFLIMGMALVTYIPRIAPAVFFSKKVMPEILNQWLEYVPSCIIGALLLSSLFMKEGNLHLAVSNTILLSAIPTVIVAYITKSPVFTVIIGVAIASALQAFS